MQVHSSQKCFNYKLACYYEYPLEIKTLFLAFIVNLNRRFPNLYPGIIPQRMSETSFWICISGKPYSEPYAVRELLAGSTLVRCSVNDLQI